jgi:hypothetical protein
MIFYNTLLPEKQKTENGAEALTFQEVLHYAGNNAMQKDQMEKQCKRGTALPRL